MKLSRVFLSLGFIFGLASSANSACPSTQLKFISGISYQVSANDNCYWLIFSNSGSVTVTLPTPAGFKSDFALALQADTNGGTITLSSGSAATINGSTSLALAPSGGAQVRVLSNNWYAVTGGGLIAGGSITNAMLAGSITASKLIGSDIATLGTVTAGTWNGALIGGTYGGTGVNNGANTITLEGNLVTSGAFVTTLTSTATTNSTLPAGTHTLAPLDSPVFTTPTLGVATATTINGFTPAAAGSLATEHLSYQPGLLTAVNATKAAFYKLSKDSTVDNIEGSAATFSCVSNPTVTVFECGVSATCTSPTTIGTVTITAAGTVVDGTISSSAITAGDYIAFAMTAGTCASVDLATTVQVHAN